MCLLPDSGHQAGCVVCAYVGDSRLIICHNQRVTWRFLGKTCLVAFSVTGVTHVSGLSPAIAIDQTTRSKYPRSTVGTVTELNFPLVSYHRPCQIQQGFEDDFH